MSTAEYQRAYRRARYLAGYRRRWPDGSRRRLEALMWQGWSLRELERQSGLSYRTLENVLTARYPRVNAELSDRIAELYRWLWALPPQGPAVERTKALARRRGYAPAMAWNDDIDELAARPEGLEHTS